MDILFVLKYRTHGYGSIASSGLLNSVKFCNDMLNQNGIYSDYAQVIDSNSIDKCVYEFKPKIVIIEAYWATPDKIKELIRLHPKVHWIIRSHSNMPFLTTESVAMDWTYNYLKLPKVSIAANNIELYNDLKYLVDHSHLHHANIKYLPNYYPLHFHIGNIKKDLRQIDIGCFGALRPLKNTVNQAIAACKFADMNHMHLKFHINSTRNEGNGKAILQNLRYLFAPHFNCKHELVEHDWLSHHEFLHLIHKIDVGMQVSFTETFNIVTADFVSQSIPVVVSKEISWVNPECFADPTSVTDMTRKIEHVYSNSHRLIDSNRIRLKEYVEKSEKQWINSIDAILTNRR